LNINKHFPSNNRGSIFTRSELAYTFGACLFVKATEEKGNNVIGGEST